MIFVRFELKPKASVDEAWGQLVSLCIEVLYSIEEPEGHKYIFGYLPSQDYIASILAEIPSIQSIAPSELEEVDWQTQWQAHGEDFREGFVNLDLHKYIDAPHRSIRIRPGPGFGDLSHPTTRLALRMMLPLARDKFVLDIGSGSGVLALAAASLDAQGVHAIDIDPMAIQHGRENAKLNELEDKMTFGFPNEPFIFPKKIPLLIVMNMIQSEQAQAWESLPQLHSVAADCVTSGILAGQENNYLVACQRWGWQLFDMQEEEGWLGFQFKAERKGK